MIEQVIGERAFYISELKAIVIGDLHIGYEKELKEKGVIIPDQRKNMRDRIEKLVKKYEAEKLIILGDLKHEIVGYISNLENFFSSLPVEVLLTKGNHDGKIEEMMKGKIYPPGGFRISDYGFFHGHSWPDENVMRAKYVFMGHLHPEIELEDSMGHKHRYPCHLIGRLNKRGRKRYKNSPRIFVVAAFNKLVGASIAKPIGPLIRNGLIEDFEVYLLNGIYLGKYSYSEFLAPE